MKRIHKLRGIVGYILLFLIVIIIISFVLLKLVFPYDSVKDGFLVTINGEVNAKINNTNHYPTYVYAYYPYHNLKQLAREGKTVSLANIEWQNNKGYYSMTFWLPIEMNLILTADATGCNNNSVYVSPKGNIKQVNLIFDGKKCNEEFNIPQTEEEVIERARENLDRIFTESTNPVFKPNETQSIKEDVKLGSKEIEEVNSENDENKSLTHAYNSYWLVWRAYYKMDLYKLGVCVEKALPYLNTNESCIVLPYEAKIDLLDANRSYESFKSSWILKKRAEDINSVDKAKNTILLIKNEQSRVNSIWRDCDTSLEIVEKSYKNQESTCNLRNQTLLVLKWSEALALICVGFIIFYPIRRWIIK